MDTLKSIRIFCTVVESGSFSKAANQLNISPAMASKHVAHLEKKIQSRLLQRNSRRLHLTEAGELYYTQSRAALEQLDAAADIAQTHNQTPSGGLRVTAPVICACPFFVRLISRYQEKFPEIFLDIDLNNHRVDLTTEGYDLALRATNHPREQDVTRVIADIPFHLVSIPTLSQKITPDNLITSLESLPAALPNYTNIDHLTLSFDGKPHTLNLKSALRSNNTIFLYHWTLLGCGISYLPSWLVQEDIIQHRLVSLLPSDALTPIRLQAVFPHRRFISAKSRSFIDFLRAELA